MLSTPYIVSICGLMKRHPKVESANCISRPKGLADLGIIQGARVICSTPPAMYISPAPSFIALEALIVAAIPEAHKRFTVSPPIVSGKPASSKDILATFRLSSPAWLAQPKITSSTNDGSSLEFLSMSDFST